MRDLCRVVEVCFFLKCLRLLRSRLRAISAAPKLYSLYGRLPLLSFFRFSDNPLITSFLSGSSAVSRHLQETALLKDVNVYLPCGIDSCSTSAQQIKTFKTLQAPRIRASRVQRELDAFFCQCNVITSVELRVIFTSSELTQS